MVAKTILMLALPLSSALLIMATGYFVARKHKRLGAGMMIAAFLMLYLLSIEPVAESLYRPLESVAQNNSLESLADIEYVIVLGGGVKDMSWAGMPPVPTSTSMARLVHGISIFRSFSGSRLILSGGSGDPSRPELSEADAMRKVAIDLGVPEESLLVENGSRDTSGNVERLQAYIKGKRNVLVTSAFHMERAVAMFRKKDVDVFPAPTDYSGQDINVSVYSFIPQVGSLGKSSTALYEYLCRLWFSLRGVM